MQNCPNCQAENDKNAGACFLCGEPLKKGLFKKLFGGGDKAQAQTTESYDISVEIESRPEPEEAFPTQEPQEAEPADAKALKELGTEYFRKGQLRQALDALTDAINMDPQYTDAYYNRGLCNLNLARYEDAVEDFDAAIRLNPEDAEAYASLGATRLRLGAAEQALRDYGEASRLEPENASHVNGRGAANFDLGRFQEAVQDFSQAMQLSPQDPYAYSNRAFSYIRLGKHAEAEEDVKRAAELGMDTSEVMEELHRRR